MFEGLHLPRPQASGSAFSNLEPCNNFWRELHVGHYSANTPDLLSLLTIDYSLQYGLRRR